VETFRKLAASDLSRLKGLQVKKSERREEGRRGEERS